MSLSLLVSQSLLVLGSPHINSRDTQLLRRELILIYINKQFVEILRILRLEEGQILGTKIIRLLEGHQDEMECLAKEYYTKEIPIPVPLVDCQQTWPTCPSSPAACKSQMGSGPSLALE